MAPPRMDERIAVEVLLELSEDRAEGREYDLEHYLARFPGHAPTVAQVWLDLTGAKEEGASATSDSSGQAEERRLGRYRLLEELGRGGQGVVYLAEDERLARHVALKVLHPGVTTTDDARLRFQREAEVASKLTHPGICTVYETGQADGVDFIAMRHVAGGNLADLIRAALDASENGERQVVHPPGCEVPAGTNRAAVNAALELVEKIARALHAAHEHGVVHRDVKPSNVLIDEDGEPVVVDFGLARDQSRVGFTLTGSGELFGTPEYMSPEQVQSSAHLDRRTDVYSLGVVLYKALALETPFAGATVQAVVKKIQQPTPPSLRKRVPGVGTDLEVVLATAMEVDRERRYQSALDFAEDLRRVRSFEPIRARPAGPALRMQRWCQRSPVLATTAGLLVLSVATVLGLTSWFKTTTDALATERDDAIDGMTRLTDSRQSQALLSRERNDLWPVGPGLVAPCDEWLEQARHLLARRGEHRATLDQLRGRRSPDGTYAVVDEGILDELLVETLGDLERLAERRTAVGERRERSATLAERSLERFADRWQDCIAEVRASATYGGLELEPQLGLVPLGRNASGLWEFWHVESGAEPAFHGTRGAFPSETPPPEVDGLVLVLLPGGTFRMGAHPHEEPNLDSGTQINEMPVHEVTLAPFFLSKFETTQAQWTAANGGQNPSTHYPGKEMVIGEVAGWSHPVQDVSWLECDALATRLGLVLPTEAQWEYACRAGTSTPFAWGTDPNGAVDYANFHAGEANENIDTAPVEGYADRHQRIAPVGAYSPNPFGLHDMHGNLWEWCADPYGSYTDPVAGPNGARQPAEANDMRAFRGGSCQYPAFYGRSARRVPQSPDTTGWELGVRFARALD